jgi:hypothetical protein
MLKNVTLFLFAFLVVGLLVVALDIIGTSPDQPDYQADTKPGTVVEGKQ